jgi:hypothetical protein
MELRWLVAAAGVAIGIVLLALVRRELAARGARRRAFAIAAALFALAAVGWLVVLTTPTPALVAWLASLPAIAVAVAPGLLVRATGGSRRILALAAEIRSLRMALSAPATTELTERRLRHRLGALDRARLPATTELIDLVQEEGFDGLDGLPVDPDGGARRADRIDALLEELAGPAPEDPA